MQLFIGFDVGGTHIKHGVINENGEELTSDEYDTPDDESTFKEKWKTVVDKYCREHEIASIGVSFPDISITILAKRPKPGRWTILTAKTCANCSHS